MIAESLAAEATREVERLLGADAAQILGDFEAGIPVRKAETAQRQGKQPDGSAKTREVKLAVAWTAERRPQDRRPDARPGLSLLHGRHRDGRQSRYRPRTLPLRPARVPRSRTPRFADADRRVILGDGAPWIWALADECFPDAIQMGAFPISRSRAHTHRRHGHPLQTVPSAGLIERPQEKNRVDALR